MLLKTFNSERLYIQLWFTDQNSKSLDKGDQNSKSLDKGDKINIL